MVSPRAAVAMDAVCTCFESDVLGLMIQVAWELRFSSPIIDVAMRRGW